MRHNNKGLSLVELIAAIAIMSIVGIAICGFITTGVNHFNIASAEVNLQYEAQLVSNQIDDLMIDSVGDIVYNGNSLYMCALDDAGNHVVHEVKWNAADSTVVYSQYQASYDEKTHTYTQGGENAKDKLLGEYIDLFDVDLSRAISSNGRMQSMKLRMHLKERDREYTYEGNITLRNSVRINAATIKKTAEGELITGNITGIVVTPTTAVMAPGTSKTFKAVVKATGNVKTEDTAVTWKILETGAKAGTGIDSNGTLSIASDETLDSITVVAELTNNPSISKSAAVSIKDVDSVVIGPEPATIEQNQTFQLTATVSGRNITSSPADQAVKWRITDGAEYVAMVGANTFKVSSLAPEGLIVTITATSSVNPSKSASRTFDVKKATGSGESGEKPEGSASIKSWPEKINRGASGTFVLQNSIADSTVSWKVEVTAKDGSKKVALREGTAYVVRTSGNSCTVEIKKAIDYELEADVKVTAIVKQNGADGKTYEYFVTSKVPKVSMTLKKHESDLPQSALNDYKLYYLQSKKHSCYYTLEGIEGEDIKWGGSGYNKNLLGIKTDKSKGKLALSVPSSKSSGTTTAVAYIGNYNLGCSITAQVDIGNVFYKTSEGNITYFYMPSPGDDDFPWKDSSNDGSSRGSGFTDYDWADMDDIVGSEHMKVYYYYDKFASPKKWYIAITPDGEKWKINGCKFVCEVGTNNWKKTEY